MQGMRGQGLHESEMQHRRPPAMRMRSTGHRCKPTQWLHGGAQPPLGAAPAAPAAASPLARLTDRSAPYWDRVAALQALQQQPLTAAQINALLDFLGSPSRSVEHPTQAFALRNDVLRALISRIDPQRCSQLWCRYAAMPVSSIHCGVNMCSSISVSWCRITTRTSADRCPRQRVFAELEHHLQDTAGHGRHRLLNLHRLLARCAGRSGST